MAQDTELLFYDGGCGLCHRAVQHVLAGDPNGQAFRFAPLWGDTFNAEVPNTRPGQLPDSIVVKTLDGRVLVKSDAVVHILRRLKPVHRALGNALSWMPRPLRDWGYDFVARIRHHLFEKPKDACPLIPPHLRVRFLP